MTFGILTGNLKPPPPHRASSKGDAGRGRGRASVGRYGGDTRDATTEHGADGGNSGGGRGRVRSRGGVRGRAPGLRGGG